MRYLSFLVILISILINNSCSSEIDINDEPVDFTSNESIPVNFNIEGIIPMNSRNIHEDSKRNFIGGEMIHIGATFYDSIGTFLKHDYTVMYLKDGKWSQGDNYREMMWPAEAYKGEFKAYYVDNIWYRDVKLTPGDQFPHILNLSDFTDATDPLYAEREELWGHKITLRFSHLCTHLTFANLDPDVADYFWLINKGNEDFNNGFSLKVTEDNELIAEFSQIKDNNYDGGLIYVQHPAESYYDEENNSKKSRVGFFLQPGDYSDIELRTINNYSYLAFQSEDTKDLEGNTPYVIEVNKNSGITYKEEKEEWDFPENGEVTKVDPEKLIESIVKNSDYYIYDDNGDSTIIVERTLVGTILRRNIDFQFDTTYVDKLQVSPQISEGQVFDGGNHFICNIATNIFTENHGTIKNLGLHNIKCNVTVSQNKEFWGVLCEQNSGNIADIRLDESDITINVGDHISTTILNVGSLIGINSFSSATLTDIVYSGNIKLETSDQENIDCNINIGGFVGQLGSGTIDGIKSYDSDADGSVTKIEIINKLKGTNGGFFVGGAVGVGITDMEKIILPDVSVDCSMSRGQNVYTGGLVGILRSSTDNPSIISLCSVNGLIKGGDIENIVTISANANSYTGGLAGSMRNYRVLDCSALCDVQGPIDAEIKEEETYGTGGAFGIISSKTDVKNNVAWGSSLSGPVGGYIGNFVGIAPEGCDWDYYYSSGNRAFDLLGNGVYVGFNQD